MGTTFRDQHNTLREGSGQFAPEIHSEPTNAATALDQPILEASTLRDLDRPAEERFRLLVDYLNDHHADDTFSQDSLEDGGPDSGEVFDAISKDDKAVARILEVAAAELETCNASNVPASEVATSVAEEAYEEWQRHNMEAFFARPASTPRMSEQEIWDAYAEHPAKRNLLLVRNGFNPFPV